MKIDFHIHTFHSKCSNLRPKDAIKRAEEVGLDAIALISHDYNPKIRIDEPIIVIPGVEVSTKEGHLLIVNTDEEFPKNRPAQEIINMAPKEALIIVPHPFDSFRKGIDKEVKNLKGYHALEVNARCLLNSFNKKVMKYKNIVAGSDSHFINEIGNAYTIVEAKTIKGAIKKIKEGKAKVFLKKRNLFERLGPFIKSMFI